MWVPSRPKEELSMKNSELYKYGNYFRYASFHECPTWKSGLAIDIQREQFFLLLPHS
jgi:hypothetical protein